MQSKIFITSLLASVPSVFAMQVIPFFSPPFLCLYVSTLPPFNLSHKLTKTRTSIGCWTDDHNRALQDGNFMAGNMTTSVCASYCENYPIFGTEYGSSTPTSFLSPLVPSFRFPLPPFPLILIKPIQIKNL